MKLLLYTAENEVDQLLMLVPEDYDEDQANTEADDFLPGATLETYFELIDDPDKYKVGKYRPYVG